MGQTDGSLTKEEIRAIFVLGIIGTLFTAAQLSPNYVMPPAYMHFTFKSITYLLLVYWGTYLFFAVVGISDDWIRERIARACRAFSKFLFLGGISIIIGMVFLAILGLSENQFGFKLDQATTIEVSATPAIFIALLIGKPGARPKSQDAAQQSPQKKSKPQDSERIA